VRAMTALFVIADALSIGIHMRGARDRRVHMWNALPAGIAPRVWSWHDSQFLRGRGE
jgi:hypothetical protein